MDRHNRFGAPELTVVISITILIVLTWAGIISSLLPTIAFPVIGFAYFYFRDSRKL